MMPQLDPLEGRIRVATGDDAAAIAAIYGPVVRNTAISFELEMPSVDEMRGRILQTTQSLPWLVAVDPLGQVQGYAYAGKHRERPAYQWSVDVTAYIREDARGKGVAKRLYRALLRELAALGYHEAFAGISLPNIASVALHESVGFKHIGIYRGVGFKLGAWRDVGWWQCSILSKSDKPRPADRFSA